MNSPAEKKTAYQCDTCEPTLEERRKGYVYAVATAILCPCHMPLWGIALGGTALSAVFEQYFWTIAIGLGLASLLTFALAARILLVSRN